MSSLVMGVVSEHYGLKAVWTFVLCLGHGMLIDRQPNTLKAAFFETSRKGRFWGSAAFEVRFSVFSKISILGTLVNFSKEL